MKRAVNSKLAPKAIGPYSQGVMAGDYFYVFGQIPVDPITNQVVEADIDLQTKQVLENIGAILNEAGLGYDDVVKCDVYMTDLMNFSKMNDVYATFFTEQPLPARVAVQVARLPKNVMIEISVVAYNG